MADKETEAAAVCEVTSPIIMKVDAPPEDSMQESNDNNVNDSKCSPLNNTSNTKSTTPSKVPILAKPKLGVGTSNPFGMRYTLNTSKLGSTTSNLGKSAILRPSKLGQANSNLSDNKISSSLGGGENKIFGSGVNPFAKVDSTDVEKSKDNGCSSSSSSTSISNSSSVETPRFVPLSLDQSSSSAASSSTHSVSSSNLPPLAAAPSFVFGQNLHERVEVDTNGSCDTENPTNHVTSSNSENTNGTSDLFSVHSGSSDQELPSTSSTADSSKSLSEAAREYEQSRAQKRKYEEVTVVTGEEDEINVMQIACKLYTFDQVTRNWQERGRGNLRLNNISVKSDDQSSTYTQSRLVVRAAGNLRVVLNTKIWAGMSLELASPTSIRLTAMDSAGIVKVFLIKASIAEIEKLYKLLKNRLDAEIKRSEKEEEASASKRKPTESDDSAAITTSTTLPDSNDDPNLACYTP